MTDQNNQCFFYAKAHILPMKDGEKFNVLLNENQAMAFGITSEDKVSLMRANKEKFVADVVLSSDIEEGTIGIYHETEERFGVKEGEEFSIKFAEAKALTNEAIRKKMKGEELTYEEMYSIIKDISRGRLSEIMMTYYVASSFFYPTTDEEMYQTAKAMAETGVTFKYPEGEIIADKHCIGGVPGNETTMIIIPIIASLGIKIPKNFSKAITSPAATGECVNVLMNINFDKKGIENLIEENNCCLVRGGALDLAPADDKIIKVQYPLSMQSRAKVVSSIMAKKYAMGVTHSLIDIPMGPTAKVKTMEEALDWKQKFEFVGTKLGMKMTVQITEANEVIGNGVGAVLQVREVLRVLQQHEKRPADLEKKAIFLASRLIEIVGKAQGDDAIALAKKQLESGEARKMMQKIIKAQGGNPDINSEALTLGKESFDIVAPKSGKVTAIDLHNINYIARHLGCPAINEAGLYLYKKIGDEVKEGEVLYTIYANDPAKLES